MKSGVYCIKNIKNNKVYIGQSININRRRYDHKRLLEQGKHNNIYLQREFNKYGSDSFTFEIIKYCPIEELDNCEIQLIKELQCMDNKYGYNMESGGNKNKIVSEATRQKKVGRNNPMYGVKLSNARIEQLRVANRGNSDLLNKEDVKVIKSRLVNGERNSDIARDYGVVNSTIDKIANGTNWAWVCTELNEEIMKVKQQLINDRNDKIKKLNSEGVARSKIAEMVGCQPRTVTAVLGYGAFDKYRSRYKEIEADFLNGLTKKEIMEKYNISQSTYVKATSEAYNKQKEETRKQAVRMRQSGMLVKDIAKELGFARTTISKWTKS